MVNNERKVVITGLGMITSLGNSVSQTWENLIAEKSGIDRISLFDTHGFSCQIAGEIKNVDSKISKKYSRGTNFGLMAAEEALRDADLIKKKEVAVFIGSSGARTTLKTFNMHFNNNKIQKLTLEELNEEKEFDRNRYSAAAETIAEKFGLKCGCYSITTACASGTQAIGIAYKKIKEGMNDIILAGGSDAMVSEIDLIGFCMLGAVTNQYNSVPQKGSRPFNKDRSGFVLGEGAGMIILEDYEHAIKRNAKIYAEVVGFGNTISGYSILDTPPDGKALATAMQLALNEAGVPKEKIGYINAHGTSTRDNDSSECTAIIKTFGELADKIPVSSTKSATGHLISGAGAIEAIFAIKAIQDQILPATLNLEDVDGKCNLLHVRHSLRKEINYVMSNSLGFGGSNSSIIFGRV